MFHEATSCVGESGIHFDAEIGLRLWEHGWQVGLYESGFRLGYEDGNDFGGGGRGDSFVHLRCFMCPLRFPPLVVRRESADLRRARE